MNSALRYRYAGPILSIRWIRVSVTVYFFARILLSYLWVALIRRRKSDVLAKAHRKNAERLYDAFILLKGVYIKAGQFLSTQVVLLPPPYLAAMARMQDRVPKAHNDAILARIEQEFGKPVDEIFQRFDIEPLATASIGQVHRAELPDGRDVVVKVRYPGITRFFMSDLKVIEVLYPWFVAIMEWAFEGRRSNVQHDLLISELVHYLRLELDYDQERRNHERMQDVMEDLSLFGDELLIPRIIPEYCRSAILVMEYIEGENLATWFLRDDIDFETQNHIYETLFRASIHGVLRHGYFQADPHPGNYMATPDGKLVMLDFGCTQQLPDAFHHGILDVIGGFMGNDPAKAAQALWDLGFRTRSGTIDSLEAWIEYGFSVIRVVAEHFQKGDNFVKHLQDNVASYSRDVLQLADKHKLDAVPSEYVMLGRAVATPPVPYNRFQPKLDLMQIIMPYIFELSTQPAPKANAIPE